MSTPDFDEANIDAKLLEIAERRKQQRNERWRDKLPGKALEIASLLPVVSHSVCRALEQDYSVLERAPKAQLPEEADDEFDLDAEWLEGIRAHLTGSADAARALAEIARELGQKLAAPEFQATLPKSVRMWSTLAREGGASAGFRLSTIVSDALADPASEPDVQARELWRWLEAARPLAQVFQKAMEPGLTVAMEHLARAIELLRRKNRDWKLLNGYVARADQDAAFRDLLAEPDDGRWALHFAGAGGIGKTMLVRHVQAKLAGNEAITTRVDFDFLSPRYPVHAPGLLYLAFIEELRPFVGSEAQSYLDRARDLVTKLHNRRATPGGDPLADELFVDATRAFGEALDRIGTSRKVVLILDTCEELSRDRRPGEPPRALVDTFRILEALKYGADTLVGAPRGLGVGSLRVVFAGRRLIASEGHNFVAKEAVAKTTLDARPYLVLHEIVGFTRTEALEFLKAAPNDEYRQAVLAVSADVSQGLDVSWKEGKPTLEPQRYFPYDLSWFARRLAEADPPTLEEVRASQGEGYVEIRILRRLQNRALEAALPVLVLLGGFDRELLTAAWNETEAAEILDAALHQEWVHEHHASTGETVLRIDPEMLKRLEHHYRAFVLGDALRGKLLASLRQRARDSTLLDVILFSALLRLASSDPMELCTLWTELEQQLLTKWSGAVSSELLGRLIEMEPWAHPKSPAQWSVRAQLIATEALAIPWRRTPELEWRLSSLDIRAAALGPAGARVEARLAVVEARHELYASLRGHSAPIGLPAADYSKRAHAAEESDEVTRWCALLECWYACQLAEWAIGRGESAQDVRRVRGVPSMLAWLGDMDVAAPGGLGCWTRILLARATLLAGDKALARERATEAAVAVGQAHDFAIPLGAFANLRGRSVAAFELAAWCYQTGVTDPTPVLRSIASHEGRSIEADRIAACRLEVALSRSYVEQQPTITNEGTALMVEDIPSEVSLWPLAQPLAAVATLAAQGRGSAALAALDELSAMQLPEEVRYRLDVIHARVVRLFRCLETGVELPESLRESPAQFTRALVATSEAFRSIRPSLPVLSRTGDALLRAAELHGLYQSTVVEKPEDQDAISNWFGQEADTLLSWPELPETFRWILLVDKAELGDAKIDEATLASIVAAADRCALDRSLVVSLALRAATMNCERPPSFDGLCERFGRRWMASTALDEAELMALRAPLRAQWLFQIARDWFARTGDRFGELRSLVSEVLLCPAATVTAADIEAAYRPLMQVLGLPNVAALAEELTQPQPPWTKTWIPWLRRVRLCTQILNGEPRADWEWFVGSRAPDLPTEVALVIARGRDAGEVAGYSPPRSDAAPPMRGPRLAVRVESGRRIRGLSSARSILIDYVSEYARGHERAMLDDRERYDEGVLPGRLREFLRWHSTDVVEVTLGSELAALSWEAFCGFGRGGPALRRLAGPNLPPPVSPRPGVSGYSARTVEDFLREAWQGHFTGVRVRFEPELQAGFIHLVGDVREDGSSTDSLRFYLSPVIGERFQAGSLTLNQLRSHHAALFIVQATPRERDPEGRTTTDRYEASLMRLFAHHLAQSGSAVLVVPALEVQKAVGTMVRLRELLIEDAPKDADDLARKAARISDEVHSHGSAYEEVASDVCLYAPAETWTNPFV